MSVFFIFNYMSAQYIRQFVQDKKGKIKINGKFDLYIILGNPVLSLMKVSCVSEQNYSSKAHSLRSLKDRKQRSLTYIR